MNTEAPDTEIKKQHVRITLRKALATDFYYTAYGAKKYRYGMVYFTRLVVDGNGGWEPHAFTLESLPKFTRLWNEGRVWIADRPAAE